MRILSWNVNGIRAVSKKGFLDWLKKESPDILCVQETKADPSQLNDELLHPKGYYSYWSAAEKKGYSGVAVYAKNKPQKIEYGLGKPKFDKEGRALVLDYNNFVLFNIYFPNGGRGNTRVPFKMASYDYFLKTVNRLKAKGEKIVICGDVNTAHTEIDIARPKENGKNTGFLPEERAWVSKFLSQGYIDTFRHFNKEPNHYTWWDYKTGARKRNVGWRIDYFFVSPNLEKDLKKAFILNNVMGSDHCPIGIELK